ncbi:MAG: acylpyruvase [Desulfuromonas sp.]|nr:MAG: acylpyruvase [Desulfuromonas sp.]
MHYVQLAEQNIPVGKIVAIGRNYAEHARELGNPIPADDQPVLFIKPASSLLADNGTVVIPPYCADCHHEIELAILIGTTGKDISQQQATNHIAGYGVALDLTLRDVQSRQKSKGLPWEIAKAFDTSCPISRFVPANAVADPQKLPLELRVNGALRQQGSTADMLRPIPRLIAEASSYFTLEAGDILLTGTPAGVGPIHSGDLIEAIIAQVGSLKVTVG